ncbi:MAG TPA: alpha/beta fold hydrolase [Ghiorsea sp.]|nr:alpha/beta fold hydrolase [Ghiorsea sp.]HIP06785.1 alpha/beta fold hydrolase [Mariprofundaceae bacterium]
MTEHRPEKLILQGPAGQIEALYHQGKVGKPAIVVCHPHPVYGGTMRNKVVYWMGRAFEEMDYSVLRFNFRGVEKSEGQWDEGIGEVDDVTAMIDWLEQKNPNSPLYLAGFSFGTYAGLQAARKDDRIQRMLAVAPAVNLWSFDFMFGETRPVTVIQGTIDEIVPFEQVQAWVKKQANIQFFTVEDAGHFFPQHLEELMQYCKRIEHQ